MGHWGIGLLQDDGALDVQNMVEDALAEGLSLPAATQRVLDDPPWGLDPEDVGPITYFALAALQLERGALQPDLRDTCLEIIAAGADNERWEAFASPEYLAAREELIHHFGLILSTGTCTAEELGEVTTPEACSLW